MRTRRTGTTLFALLAVLYAIPAMAGDFSAVPSMMAPIYMNNNIVSNMMGSARLGLHKHGNSSSASSNGNASSSASASVSTSRDSSDDLYVGRDQGISAKARQMFLADVTRTNGQDVANELDRQFGDVQSTFARAVSPYGLRADNFADVMTAYTVMMWLTANRQVQLPGPAQVGAVRSQLRATLAGTLGDASQRQLIAESMMYQACVLIAARDKAEQGKPQMMDAASAAMDGGAGVDANQLRQLALTDQGLVKR